MKRRLVSALLLGVSGLTGCAGNWPFLGNSNANPSTATQRQDPNLAKLDQATQKQDDDGFTAALRRTGTAISNAFKIEPKVTPADDPTSLRTKAPPLDATVHNKAAEVFVGRGDLQGAIAQHRRGLEVEPGNLESLISIARLYDRQGNGAQAEKFYQQAITAHPKAPLPLNDMGLFYARQRRLDESLQMLQRAVDLDPKKALYRNNIATVLIAMNRAEEAVQHLMAILPPAEAHYNTGFLLYRRGRPDAAVQHLTQAVRIDPSMTAANQLLQELSSPAATPLPGKSNAAAPAVQTPANLQTKLPQHPNR